MFLHACMHACMQKHTLKQVEEAAHVFIVETAARDEVLHACSTSFVNLNAPLLL